MKTIKTEFRKTSRPLAVSVAMIILGFTVQWAIGKKIGQTVGGCMIFVGLIIFALSMFFILRKEHISNGSKS